MPFTLKRGDSGRRVFLLQQALSSAGLLSLPDGHFGAITDSAVKSFQESNELVVDGIVGPKTLQSLIKSRAETSCLPLTQFQVEFICNNRIAPEDLVMLNGSMEVFNISTPAQIRHFLAQIAHESGGLRYFEEIADGSAYEGREDLGNVEEGDGMRFKGFDPIQTTGRYNYRRLSNYLKDPRVMEGIEYVKKDVPRFIPSGFWWHDNEINAFIDSGATCRQVSRRVNGTDPALGLAEREEYYAIACEVIHE